MDNAKNKLPILYATIIHGKSKSIRALKDHEIVPVTQQIVGNAHAIDYGLKRESIDIVGDDVAVSCSITKYNPANQKHSETATVKKTLPLNKPESEEVTFENGDTITLQLLVSADAQSAKL
jgi:hypothetical protein